MADLVRTQAFCGITEGRAGRPALFDAVELGGDELVGVDGVFGDCQPEGLGESSKFSKVCSASLFAMCSGSGNSMSASLLGDIEIMALLV